MPKQTTIERAYELARTGRYSDIHQIRKRLRVEKFDDIDEHLDGMQISSELSRICRKSALSEPAEHPVDNVVRFNPPRR